MKFAVGDIVQFVNITHDEFDRPILDPPTPLKVVRINDADVPHRSFDYEVVSTSGNHFFVYEGEITEFVGV